ATAAGFLASLRWWARVFRLSRLPRPATMAIVGLALGLTILRVPEVVGNGREAIRDLFLEDWGAGFALLLFGLRLLLTPATVGSGAVGGVFTPTLFLGAMLGHAFGTIVQTLAPSLGVVPKAYALIGMCALLAGTTHAPLTASLMLFEMTLDYSLIVPMLVAAATASLAARGLDRESVSTEALRRKRGGTSQLPEATVLHSLTVRDVMRREQATVPVDLPVGKLLEGFIAARRNHLYVVDTEGRL